MACPAISTGAEFLVGTLAHLDCQAQTLGSFGFQSLAAIGSPAAAVLTALLTLFIAIYGIRLLFGPGDEPATLINAGLKAAIVLTIAMSWPAWRIVAFDTVLYGPADIAATIMPSAMPDPRASLPQHLQGIDAGMASLTAARTGRDTGLVVDGTGFQGVALADETGLGWARPVYLASTIGVLGLLRIAGGLLLALAPLMAGLLLFDFSCGLFAGWLRGLAFVALGSLGVTVVLSVQVAIMEPWLADALERRSLGYATPTAPTELLALSLAFAAALAGTLLLLARIAFQSSWALRIPAVVRLHQQAPEQVLPRSRQTGAESPIRSRAAAIAEGVTTVMRREEARAEHREHARRIETLGRPDGGSAEPGSRRALAEPLGNGYRRSARRETTSQRSRDKRE
jgi:type IV secretion system protein VirB6